MLTISDEVQEALAHHRPVVALESTVIAHGLPYPQNVEIALAMEDAVRQAGAIPATIAILKGEMTVGIGEKGIDYLGSRPSETIRKCSRRDLPIVVGLKADGATTVAGTMILAHMAGINIFATGGIGGVHRGHPFDVSADLIELGRTPVTVVCAGAKSLLDLPLTLEVLETQGVPIIGYGVDSLPAFYTRESGLPIDIRLDTPQQVASVIHAAGQIGASHGILVTVPVPHEHELPLEIAENAITQANAEAERQGIVGKHLTPFLLRRIGELTDDLSRTANRALLLNNATIAGQIANELTNMGNHMKKS
ncbi:MAG: pseudouridine-5-phosphate glycosidase [Phototrophicales bacterium]|nr:MAG: pseudouridine-5-phosphate glycosidase [Phototrophicales bacterium]